MQGTAPIIGPKKGITLVTPITAKEKAKHADNGRVQQLPVNKAHKDLVGLSAHGQNLVSALDRKGSVNQLF